MKRLTILTTMFFILAAVYVFAGPIISEGEIDDTVPTQDGVANTIMRDVVGNKTDTAASPAATTSIIAIIKEIYSVADAISASIFTLTETGGTVTTDGNEQNVYINNAPAGVFSPRQVFIDFTNHTAGETVVVREYYRIKTGGNLIKLQEDTYVGVQDPLLLNIELKDNRFGLKVTIQKTVGTNRAYDWEVFYAL